MQHFSLVVACTSQGGIGFQNKIPWHIKEDYQHFKAITTETTTSEKWNVVIMGRKTWDSLPKKPLPQRINMVISRQRDLKIDAIVCSSLAMALRQCHKFQDVIEKIFVIGGAEIYREALKHERCQAIYMTRILFPLGEPEMDTFVPELQENQLLKQFTKGKVENVGKEKNIEFTMITYRNVNEEK